MASPLAAALMQPQGYQPGQLQPTNVTADYQLSQNAAEQNYQAQLAQNNAMWGGLAGLGSAGVIGAANYLSRPAAAAASTAAAAPAAGAAGSAFGSAPVAFPGIGSLSDLFAPAAGAGAADAFAAGAPVAADVAATAAPAAADAAGGASIADLLPFLATLFA